MSSKLPSLSIIIPARDEEQYLPRCLASIRRSAAHAAVPVEIIVVLNRCTDRTEQIALAAGCKVRRDDSRNLSQIRNAGAAEATGDLLATIDADSIVSLNMVSSIVKKLARSDVVGGGTLIITDRLSLGILLTGICLLPLVLKERVSAGLFYCRKKDFEAIGGFNEQLVSVEDIDFARRLKQYGALTGRKFRTILNAYIKTSSRKFDRFGDWYLLLNPAFFRSLLSGTNGAAANSYWYDLKR